MVRITLENGVVDLSPLKQIEHETEPGFIHKTFTDIGLQDAYSAVPLMKLCQCLDSGGKQAAWLWTQIACLIAQTVDADQVEEASGLEAEGGSDADASEVEGEVPGALFEEPHDGLEAGREFDMSDGEEEYMATELFASKRGRLRARKAAAKSKSLKMEMGFAKGINYLTTVLHYFMSARTAFDFRKPKRKHVSFTVDGSTVGNKGRMLGYFAKPDNTGAFAPPVAGQGDKATTHAHARTPTPTFVAGMRACPVETILRRLRSLVETF